MSEYVSPELTLRHARCPMCGCRVVIDRRDRFTRHNGPAGRCYGAGLKAIRFEPQFIPNYAKGKKTP